MAAKPKTKRRRSVGDKYVINDLKCPAWQCVPGSYEDVPTWVDDFISHYGGPKTQWLVVISYPEADAGPTNTQILYRGDWLVNIGGQPYVISNYVFNQLFKPTNAKAKQNSATT